MSAALQICATETSVSSIVSKLTSLGYTPRNGGAPKADGLQNPADRVGFLLPRDYREFLTAFPVTGRFDRQIVFSGIEKSPWAADGLEMLEAMYAQCSDPLDDLLEVRKQYGDQIPSHFLAIGLLIGANQLCLDLRTESLGKIYVWDHEHFDDARKGFYLAAPSFTAFVDLLHEDQRKAREEGPKLVKMELSDSLKALLAQRKKK
jgi:SMI1/KNR4 family protein SUKH-1